MGVRNQEERRFNLFFFLILTNPRGCACENDHHDACLIRSISDQQSTEKNDIAGNYRRDVHGKDRQR